MQKIRILIIDEKTAAIEIKSLLEVSGYEVVGIASDSHCAIEFVSSLDIDIIISEIKIKGELNGIKTISLIHKIKNIPTIFLTALCDDNILKEVSKVNFACYIVKPYLQEQLLREVRLICLRYSLEETKPVTNLPNGYHFDQKINSLYLYDKLVELTQQELALIKLLIQNIGNIVTIEAVELALWYDKAVSANSRRQLLFRLKSKLQGLTIETIKDNGYKLHKENETL